MALTKATFSMVDAPVANVKDFGATGDGVTNDTAAIQAALDASADSAEVFFPAGTYITNQLDIPSNSVLRFMPGTILKAATGYTANEVVLFIADVENVTIYGNSANINMLKAEYVTGEQRHCVRIIGSDNVSIYNLNGNDSGGDAFYVGSSLVDGLPSTNVSLIGCGGNNNKRQGLSVTGCVNFLDLNGRWTNTTGTSPSCGIDIEPNNSMDLIQNINIIGPYTEGNTGGGILVALDFLATTASSTVSINITGHRSTRDGQSGVAAFRCAGNNAQASLANTIYGQITYSDFVHDEPYKNGIYIGYWDGANLPTVVIKDGVIKNANYGNSATIREKAAIDLFAGSGSIVTGMGNFKIENVKVYDSRGTPLTYAACYIEAVVQDINNFSLIDVTAEGFTPTGQDIVKVGSSNNGTIQFSKPLKKELNSTSDLQQFGGREIVFTNSSTATYTLPDANDCVNQEFILRNAVDENSVIAVQAGQIILQNGLSIGNSVVLSRNGDMLRLLSLGSDKWQVTYISDRAKRPFGYSTPGTVVWSTAAPSSGTWELADIAYNSDPASGEYVGWICTVAGTPGTWKGFGVIA